MEVKQKLLMINKRVTDTLKMYIVVFYLLLMSGSVIQHEYMDLLQKINILVSFLLLLVYYGGNERFLIIKKNALNIFMLLSGIGLLLMMILWGDLSGISSYIGRFSLLLTPYLLVKHFDFTRFKYAFIKTMLGIAIVSIVLFCVPSLLKMLPRIDMGGTGSSGYSFYFIYARFSNTFIPVLQRNIGIFWEPGMYQGFLIFTMLLISFEKKQKGYLWKQIVFGIALITTQSTTGLLLLPFVAYVYVVCLIKERVNTKFVNFISTIAIFSIVIALIIPDTYRVLMKLFPSEIMEKLMDTENTSRNTRFYNFMIDGSLILKYPYGIPNNISTLLRSEIRNNLALVTDSASTNTTMSMALNYGIISGVMYLYLTVRACFHMVRDKVSAVITLVIVMTVLNTEPHYLCLLFNVFIFYYASEQSKK